MLLLNFINELGCVQCQFVKFWSIVIFCSSLFQFYGTFLMKITVYDLSILFHYLKCKNKFENVKYDANRREIHFTIGARIWLLKIYWMWLHVWKRVCDDYDAAAVVVDDELQHIEQRYEERLWRLKRECVVFRAAAELTHTAIMYVPVRKIIKWK